MFLHLSDSVHRKGSLSIGASAQGVSIRGSLSRGSMRGLCHGDPPSKYGARAGDTHPTGMHSCFTLIFL